MGAEYYDDEYRFQSTHPARGATAACQVVAVPVRISIHAPREGCDGLRDSVSFLGQRYFNPRTPRGVRLRDSVSFLGPRYFNPRTPRGVRRFTCFHRLTLGGISIHAPREGCDEVSYSAAPAAPEFQSTHPARGATAAGGQLRAQGIISIHAPRAGCDGIVHVQHVLHPIISIHAPREGCDCMLELTTTATI